MDPSLKDLLDRLLDKDPRERIQIADLREHMWLTRHGGRSKAHNMYNAHLGAYNVHLR